MHSNGNSQMGNTNTHQRPATYHSSLKESLVAIDFWNGILRFHYLNWVSSKCELALAFIGGHISDDSSAQLHCKILMRLSCRKCSVCSVMMGIRITQMQSCCALNKKQSSVNLFPFFWSQIVHGVQNSLLSDMFKIMRGELLKPHARFPLTSMDLHREIPRALHG